MRRNGRVASWVAGGCVLLSVVAVVLLLSAEPLYAQGNYGARVLQSDANRVVLEFDSAGYAKRTAQIGASAFTYLSIDGLANTNDPGKPRLPVAGATVGIPAGAQVSIKVLEDTSRRDALAYPPLPGSRELVSFDPRQTLPDYKGMSTVPDPTVYSSRQVYPLLPVKIASTGNWRSQRYAVVQFSPIQYDPAARQLIFNSRLVVELTFTYPGGMRAETLGRPVNEGPFESVLQKTLVNYASAKNWRSKQTANVQTPRATRRSGSGPWYKIEIPADGMYRLSCSDLADAGIDLTTLDPRTVKIFKSGSEIALQAVGQSDGRCDTADRLEFFGQGTKSKYTVVNIYWLTYGGAAGRRMPLRDVSGDGTPVDTFTNTLHFEENRLYRSYLPMTENADHWYGEYLAPMYGTITATHQISLPNAVPSAYSSTLRVDLRGFSTSSATNTGLHHTQLLVNNNLVADLQDSNWKDQTQYTTTVPFDSNLLLPGWNTVKIVERNDLDSKDVIFVNSFDIDYPSSLRAVTDTIRFRQPVPGNWGYNVDGFSTSSVETFDISDPLSTTRLSGAGIAPSGPEYAVQFSDNVSSPREYLALESSQFNTPNIYPDTASDLRSTSNSADYIIVSFGDFISSLQPLTELRSAQGLRVKVVDVQDVYDEFSDGLTDAQAIRDFLAYTYDYWQPPAPSFVLLVGDGNFDPKGYCEKPGFCSQVTTPPNSTFVPPFLRYVDPWLGETASDNRFVSFGDGAENVLPYMAIGRLPADSDADVAAMVNKIVTNEQNPPAGDWKSKITFVADAAYKKDGSPDSAGNFWEYSDEVASDSRYVYPPYSADRIYYNPCLTCPLPYAPYTNTVSVRNAITSAINSGRLIVNYVGHGGIQVWGNDSIFRPNEVNSLSNSAYPLILALTCYDGYFHYPGDPANSSIAETNVRLDGRGALASWSSSGLGLASGHDYLDRGFFDAVFQQGVREIGMATLLGKVNLFTYSTEDRVLIDNLIDTFNLLGDPASRLAVSPPAAVTLSSFGAVQEGYAALVRWTTASEPDNTGFNLFRSDSLNGFYTQINPSLIPSKCPGCGTGASYSFTDANVTIGKTYYYKLQAVSATNGIQVSTPFSVTIGYLLYLPWITK